MVARAAIADHTDRLDLISMPGRTKFVT